MSPNDARDERDDRDAGDARGGEEPVYDDEEQRLVAERLEALGYIE